MISPLSITMRWRKLPRTIATAASSSDHSGRGVDDVAGQVLADNFHVRVLPHADRVQDVALGQDARPGRVGVEHDGRAHAPLRHRFRRLPQGVARPDRQDHAAHPVTHLHPEPLLRPLNACNDCLKLKSTIDSRARQCLR